MLVSDNLVQTEKIGTSNYYYSYPNDHYNKLLQQKKDYTAEIKDLQARNLDLDAKISESNETAQDEDERLSMIERIKKEEVRCKDIACLIQEFKAPIQMAKEESLTKLAKAAANRWTDNIFILESYLSDNFNVETGAMRKEFKIPLDLDSIL